MHFRKMHSLPEGDANQFTPQAPDAAVPAGSGGVADWHLPVSALAASGAKVVFVASPNNPSATLVRGATITPPLGQIRVNTPP